MNLIKIKLSDSKSIIAQFKEYEDLLEPFLEEQMSKKDLIHVKKNITSLHKIFETAEKTVILLDKVADNFDGGTHILFEVYGEVQNLFITLDNIIQFLNQTHLQPENLYESNLSETYKLTVGKYLRKLLLQYKVFVSSHIKEDIETIEHFSSKISDWIDAEYQQTGYSQIITAIQYICKQFQKNHNAISLYAKVMQDIIDKLYQSGTEAKIQMFKIMDILEKDKSEFLQGHVQNITGKKYDDIHLYNPPLKRFGLIPVTNLMSMDALWNIALNGQISGKISLDKFAKSSNACIIILNHVVYNPTEYTVRSLIIPKEARPLIESKKYGITAKKIQRFQNIKQISNDEHKWNFSYKIYGNIDKANKFYLFETLDDKNLGLPRFRIEQFLQYITNNNAPNRVSNYHSLMIKQSTQNMFLQQPLNLDILTGFAKNIDIHSIINFIYTDILHSAYEIIDKKHKTHKYIKGHADINAIIHNPALKIRFIDSILRNFDIGSQTFSHERYNAGKFPFYESYATFLADLRYIAMRFMKMLHDAYNRNPLPNITFEEDSNTYDEIIQNLIAKLLKDTLNTILNQNDNLFINLNYKYASLNFY